MRHALARLFDALRGPPPWRVASPAEVAVAWTQTQLMWSAPATCPRGDG